MADSGRESSACTHARCNGVSALCHAQHPGIIGLQLDVTKQEDVQTIADQVAADNPQGLYALVNNAGPSAAAVCGAELSDDLD